MSVFLTFLSSQTYLYAAEPKVELQAALTSAINEDKGSLTDSNANLASEALTQQMQNKLSSQMNQVESSFDSAAMLEQQQNSPIQTHFNSIEFEELDEMTMPKINQAMVDDILRIAEEAKQEAQIQAQNKETQVEVQDASTQELAEINRAPVEVDALMQRIEQESNIVVSPNQAAHDISDSEWAAQIQPELEEEPGFFRKILNRIRPQQNMQVQIPRISADVSLINSKNPGTVSDKAYNKALDNLKANIKAKLSTFSQESFQDFSAALPQLRNLSRQAAQAVGFYQAEFRFEAANERQVRVIVDPKDVVVVNSQNIEFSGAGETHPRFQIVKVLPDLEEDDVFHQGLYASTKSKIDSAASDNGFFDGYWRLHDVKLAQPENTADINLRYETGERYSLAAPIFRMSDSEKPFPLRREILEQLVPWEAGDDFTNWRINALANNLTNSRYFNFTTVDAVRPDPIIKQNELPPDVQALVDEYQLDASTLNPKPVAQVSPALESNVEVTQNVISEDQFAGVTEAASLKATSVTEQQAEDARREEQEQLKTQARANQQIPVIVELNADRLNSAELGAGFGTDTGPRVRAQYRRAIVNDRGHSFDANMEVSQIRQAIDGRYNIPYKHPLNDYIAIVGGYEREERDHVANNSDILIESAVLGADRVIKNPRGSWQHNYGVRYRLDRLTLTGDVDPTIFPPAFSGGLSGEQQSLLFGYELSRTDTDRRINPTQGFKQTYKVEVGSENLLTDTNLAILNAKWAGLYSLGEEAAHQFVGRADLGYIFSDEFNKVPYNLRYFTGGDQSLRGFDYKSLSPEIAGYKIGGQALAVGSVEYNYQFKPGWRAAVFSDFGNAYDEKFSNETEYGVGLGIRWASPIGPIRIDVASGISDPGKPIRVHFFIGSQL